MAKRDASGRYVGKSAQATSKTKSDKDGDIGAPHRGAGHCSLPNIAPRALPSDVHPMRARLIRRHEKKWANRTVLHYHFLENPSHWRGSNGDKDAVRRAFQEWKDVPIGLEFIEVFDPQEAEIRIGFFHHRTAPDAGSWSYVGRDSIDLEPDPTQRTMNFGWDLTDEYGYDTALHEIGHALGFPHEHQNPNSGIIWNERAVLDYYAGSPNFWSEEQTRWNVLRKLSQSEVDGSDWDRDSIMHYWIKAGLVDEPADLRSRDHFPAPGLSETDIATARQFYPAEEPVRLPELRPFQAHPVSIGPGEQLDFVIEPDFSRRYTIATFGTMDTVMVLFEEIDGEPRYLSGDDDSGQSYNAKIEYRLMRDRRYFIRLRLYYSGATGQGAIMMY